MSNDLDIIAQLEKRIGKKLPRLGELKELSVGYRLDNKGRVIVLILHKCQLTKLPEEICQLQNLQHLFLTKNQLTQLPKEIGQLQELKNLFLEHNQLTSLPKEIGELKNLVDLHCGVDYSIPGIYLGYPLSNLMSI